MEDKCVKCGKRESEVELLEGIDGDEIVKICASCSDRDNITTINRPNNFQLSESQKPYTVYQRLSRMAGVNRAPGSAPPVIKSRGLTLDNLRPSRDFSEALRRKQVKLPAKPLDLVENYNWKIQQERRKRKLSLHQLGEAIGENQDLLKFIEGGMLTNDSERIIAKIEQYFRIKLRNSGALVESFADSKQPARILSFDPKSMDKLTLHDLKKMKEAREQAEKQLAVEEVAESKHEGGKSEEVEEIKPLVGAEIEIFEEEAEKVPEPSTKN